MSGKISVVTISLALVSLLFCSCAPTKDTALNSLFESSFSADVSVECDGGEYEATLTLAQLRFGESEASEGEDYLRDGNIAYTYPETVSGISAVRMGGEVTVNVCGIELKPSENIAKKYTALIDTVDIRACEIERVEYKEHEGRECAVLYVEHGDESAQAYIERGSNIPIMIKTDTLCLTFKSFTKL